MLHISTIPMMMMVMVNMIMMNAHYILAMFDRAFVHLIPEVFIVAYSVFARSKLKYYIQAWSRLFMVMLEK